MGLYVQASMARMLVTDRMEIEPVIALDSNSRSPNLKIRNVSIGRKLIPHTHTHTHTHTHHLHQFNIKKKLINHTFDFNAN
jgi:hypothetical protein